VESHIKPLGEKPEHFALFRPATGVLLREHRLAVTDDVELRLGAADRARVETGCPELGRETRGPFVVPVSDRAVKDLDGHRARLYSRAVAIAERRAGA
jgi:hypothetical protein